MNTATIVNAVIKRPPGKTFPSKYEDKPAQRNVQVEWNGTNAECWFDVGSDLEYLQSGDRVLITPKMGNNGKPRCDIHLDETLAAELQRRRARFAPVDPATVEGNKPISPYHDTASNAVLPQAERWSEEHRRGIRKELEQREKILSYCLKRISETNPDIGEHVAAQMAIALYQDLSKLF